MMIHKKPSVNYNKRFKRLDTQLNDSTYENSRKVHKVVMPTNKKTLIKNFGDKCNKQPVVPFLPGYKDTTMDDSAIGKM